MSTIYLQIKGKVQGVFFRASAKEIADKTGITGWIRNTSSGDVEALVTGDARQLEDFIAWCKQGPPGANVSKVISSSREEATFKDFRIVR